MRAAELALFSAILLAPVFAHAQKLVLEYGDVPINGQGTLFLKRDLQTRYPSVSLMNLQVARVILLAKSAHGQGRATLVVDQVPSNPATIPGVQEDFQDPSDYTFSRIELLPPTPVSRGVLQIQLQGNIKVRKVVVVTRDHFGPGPGPGPGPRRDCDVTKARLVVGTPDGSCVNIVGYIQFGRPVIRDGEEVRKELVTGTITDSTRCNFHSDITYRCVSGKLEAATIHKCIQWRSNPANCVLYTN